jgi:predicted HAD superfamily Cof-like phosphohydrolase
MPADNYVNSIREFHRAFGVPQEISIDSLALRLRLIREEYLETESAFNNYIMNVGFPKTPAETIFNGRVELGKELIDLLYVTFGALDILGYSAEPMWNRVHSSNMSKLGEDGKPVYRDDGKVLKGPNYKEAFLRDLC